MSGLRVQRVRCAICTRKSSEEGLEQDFNSLDAQREACAAYVLSQASEGWVLLPDLYDDGGISGSTLERPALQRLMADAAAGRIDTIVVYKVDRLTRALLDFSKLVEAFDAAGTSFVSVTQSFNTTTGMGRLTLNMLLSFAQFERKVTAERIRDKIAASKAKGMWMGGTPPLGYRPDGRSLAIVDPHAAIIRDMFARYLETGNVRLVAEQLARDGVGAPVRTRSGSGKAFGGVVFTRGQIYAILKNPTYVGEVHHRGSVYPGLHPAILERETWDRTRAMLAANLQGARSGVRVSSPSLLAGLIVDRDGLPLIATHATRPLRSGTASRTRYRYYVSRALHHDGDTTGLRIPAPELEAAVCDTLARAFEDPLALTVQLHLPIRPADLHPLITRGAELAGLAAKRDRALVRRLTATVRVSGNSIAVELSASAIVERLQLQPDDDAPPTIKLTASLRLTRTGRGVRLVQDNGVVLGGKADPALIVLIIKARRWWDMIRDGEVDVTALAVREAVTPSYLTRVLRLAFLAPAVVDAALAGTLRVEDGCATVTATDAIDASWSEQRRAFLPS